MNDPTEAAVRELEPVLAGAMLVRPVGRRALLLEVDGLDAVRAWAQVVAALVADGALPAPDDVVPGARTLLLDGVDPARVRALLEGLGPPAPVRPSGVRDVVEVPVVYDGVDLAEVARFWGVSEREVVARHTGTEFTVAFCGFAPGFAYLVGLDVEVPRRATPRPVVPAGSVGLAGRYCGVYPTSSPGGWQLLGTTRVPLFDAGADPPALLPPGARVRFVEVAEHPARPLPATPGVEPAPTGRSLGVVRAGPLSTVQDGGRVGLAHLGVPRAGPLDRPAARLANRLVGNAEDAAVLETTLGGVAVRAGTALTMAVTGAPSPVTVDGRPLPFGVAVAVGAGEVLDVGPAVSGVRSYLAVGGGLAPPPVLGSRSRDTLSGLGPAPLADGDVLAVGPATGPTPAVSYTVPPVTTSPVVLRVSAGPRADRFGDGGLAVLLGSTYEVSAVGNRVGTRLAGPPVPRSSDAELESEGMVLGAVQVPPDGQPVVLLADHPTTGGYPVIAVVHPDGLAALAQARPGSAVRFVIAAAGPV